MVSTTPRMRRDSGSSGSSTVAGGSRAPVSSLRCRFAHWRRLRGAGLEPLTTENGDYPFHLALNPQAAAGKSHGELWVEIHPHTAQALGLQNGKPVKLVSPAGRIQAKVQLNVQLALDVLALPWSAVSSVVEFWNARAGLQPVGPVGYAAE